MTCGFFAAAIGCALIGLLGASSKQARQTFTHGTASVNEARATPGLPLVDPPEASA